MATLNNYLLRNLQRHVNDNSTSILQCKILIALQSLVQHFVKAKRNQESSRLRLV